jgi:electron transfer flavoprotein beta subunit
MTELNVLVAIKRVPGSAGTVVLTEDAMGVDTRHVGYTVSPHEECAVEAAVQVTETHGGEAVVLTVGPQDAIEQLRDALAVGVRQAVHVIADSDGYGPADVAAAITDVVRAHAVDGRAYDLLLFGTDAADTGDFQVGIRTAYLLGIPVVSGVRSFEVDVEATGARLVIAIGDGPDGEETFEVPLPAVLTIKEGGITPRYPSIPGRLKAKKAPVEQVAPTGTPAGTGRLRLTMPPELPSQVQILGTGADGAPALVDVLIKIGVVGR